jgi:nucleotide-binding universal stress UspA family protein
MKLEGKSMFGFKRILFPVDFSERSRGAAVYANALAERFNSEVILLHVREIPLEVYGPLGVYEALDESSNSELEEKLAHFFDVELAGRKLKPIVVFGSPALKIIEIAESQQADLILMPSHGYGPFRRFMLGSVTAKVLHDAQIPVLTGVHMAEAPQLGSFHVHNIACAVHLDGDEGRVLRWASDMAAEYNARLTAIHMVPGIESRPGKYFDAELNAALTASAREELTRLLQQMNIQAEICVNSGNIARGVREAAERHRADMLIIGRGEPGIVGRLRTNAYAITRESPCPVLSI